MLPLIVRLVWTLPCLFTATRVDAALVAAVIVDAAFYTAVRVDAVLHTAVTVDAAPCNADGVGVTFPLCCG